MSTFATLSRRTVIGLGLAALVVSPAEAAKRIKLTEKQASSVNAISDYMNSFKTIKGEFTQISPKGNLSRGVFYIAKPGKMRFEYAPPNPYLIVADGTWLTIKNTAKEKGDQFPLSQTPLRLVLADRVDLLRDTDIINFSERDGVATVTIEDKKNTLGSGQLVLVFDRTRNMLQQWAVIDGKGRRTTVSLENIVAGEKADPKLFVVKIRRKNTFPK